MSELAMSSTEREQFLAEPHIAVMSVADSGNRPPLSVPVWYHYEPGGELTFFTGTQGRTARKTALIEQARAVTVVVQQESFPYRYVSVECSLIGTTRPPTAEEIVAIVGRYLPPEQAQGFADGELANPGPSFVLFRLRPERWHSSDFGKMAE